MASKVQQGDILKIEKIHYPVLVVSKDFFNASGAIIGCPIYTNSTPGPLHISVSAEEIKGYVQCEKMALLDLTVRGHIRMDRIPIGNIMNITDAIQGIFEYI